MPRALLIFRYTAFYQYYEALTLTWLHVGDRRLWDNFLQTRCALVLVVGVLLEPRSTERGRFPPLLSVLLGGKPTLLCRSRGLSGIIWKSEAGAALPGLPPPSPQNTRFKPNLAEHKPSGGGKE